MFSIETKPLNETNLTQTVLATIEDVCQQFGLNKDFGYISLSTQIIAEYLSESNSNLFVTFSVYIDTDTLTIVYSADREFFKNFFSEFNEIEGLRLLTGPVEASTDNKALCLNFHVKPKFNYLYQNRLNKPIYQNISSI